MLHVGGERCFRFELALEERTRDGDNADVMPRSVRGRSWGIAVCVAMAVSACAGLRDSPEQELAYTRWSACEPPSGLVDIDRVEPDGRIWFSYFVESERQKVITCLSKADQGGGPSLPTPVGIFRGKGGA